MTARVQRFLAKSPSFPVQKARAAQGSLLELSLRSRVKEVRAWEDLQLLGRSKS